MTSTLRLAILAALGVAAPLLSQTSAALDAAQPEGSDQNSLNTIVVTAEKREEVLQNVPMSVTALPGAALDKLQDRDFADYAALIPGLSLTSSQPGYTTLTLRGQNAGGDGSTVAVYLDEAPFGSSSALLNGTVLSGDFDTWDLQRIEVLRGPQGTLYGANSEGGLIKFVTNAPVLGSFSGAAEVTGEGVDHGGKGGDVRGMLNLPLGDKMALRISGFDQDVPGFIDDPQLRRTDVNDGHKYGGRVSLLAAPTDALSIRLTATTQESRYNGTPQVDVDPLTYRPLHGDLTQQRFTDEPSKFMYDNYNALVNWNAGPLTVTSTTSYGILKSETTSDATSDILIPPNITLGEFLGLEVGPGLGGYETNDTGLKKFTQELRFGSPASDFLEWQAGAYFTHEIGHLLQHLNTLELATGQDAGLPSLEIPILNSTYKEIAGFANATVHFTSQFDIQVGARYAHNEQTAFESVTGLLVPTPEIFNADSSGHVTTWSVAPRFRIDADTMLYGRIATGYRPGGPNVLPPLAPPDVPRQYNADRTTNFELGVRSTQLAGALSIDAALFRINWRDIQLLEDVDNIGVDANGGKARSQGVEWTVGYVPMRGLTFSWTGALTDAYLTTPAPAVSGDIGDPLPFVPKWSTSLDAEYDWAAFADYKGFIGGTYSYIGSRRSDFASSVTLDSQVVLPGYNTYAARVGLDNNRYRLTLYAKNLSDARGITAYASSGAPGLAGEVAVIQPRTVGLTLSAKF